MQFFIFKPVKCLSDCNGIRTHNHLVRKRTLNHLGKLGFLLTIELRFEYLSVWCIFVIIICYFIYVHLCYHVPYAFQSESTLYSCLNIKELLARNRRDN